MTGATLVWAGVLVVLAGAFSMADAALSGFSRARAAGLAEERRTGSAALLRLLVDPAPHLNTALLLRLVCETASVVLVSLWMDRNLEAEWPATAAAVVGVMLVVSFVIVGVAPRTLGRQHAETVALASAGPLGFITSILGPIPKLLILIGNAITPGRGFREGPFQSEAELRELVDLAEASQLIESVESKMIHSVFELGDTIAREVMVPRTDIVYIERHKNLRQTMSLFLRSGYSRIPVIEENLDDIIGMVYLKDVVRRDFEAPQVETSERVDQLMRAVHYVPDTKPADALLSELQAMNLHIAVVVDEYGGTAGLITIEDILEEIVGEITDEYDEAEVEVERCDDGSARVSARYPVDDLDEIFGINVIDDDVDTVLGLMAKHLGRVPIHGSTVDVHGMRFEAEHAAGRRNQIKSVLIRRTELGKPSAERQEEER